MDSLSKIITTLNPQIIKNKLHLFSSTQFLYAIILIERSAFMCIFEMKSHYFLALTRFANIYSGRQCAWYEQKSAKFMYNIERLTTQSNEQRNPLSVSFLDCVNEHSRRVCRRGSYQERKKKTISILNRFIAIRSMNDLIVQT